jgi:creatinine amidohydrolase
MSWNWENLTSPDFEKAVQKAGGVCLVPIGVIERHGDHLPLGTDLLMIRSIAERAALREPAVIFPSYYLSQVQETKNYPGTIAVRSSLQFELLDAVCEEIARNGMTKILLLNGHGGNEFLLPHFMFSRLERTRPYTPYLVRLAGWMEAGTRDPGWKPRMQSAFDYHAGEIETSAMLAAHPELVRLDQAAPGTTPRGHLAHLPNVMTSVWWYADYPEQYAGDARPATAEKGEFLMERFVDRLAGIIRSVKNDTRTAELEREYHKAARSP